MFLRIVVYAQVQMLGIFSNIHDTVLHLIAINIFLDEGDIYVKVEPYFYYVVVRIFCVDFFLLKVRPLQIILYLRVWFGLFFFAHLVCSVTSR